jgi:hypothetical protein
VTIRLRKSLAVSPPSELVELVLWLVGVVPWVGVVAPPGPEIAGLDIIYLL